MASSKSDTRPRATSSPSSLPLAAVLVGLAVAVAVSLAASNGTLRTSTTSAHSLQQGIAAAASAFFEKFGISLPGFYSSHSFGAGNDTSASNSTANNGTCTCGLTRLSGVVDDCCCEYETVDSLNRDVLQPLLQELVQTPFFRYFKVRLWCDCPFWREDGMCHSRDCSVGECSEDEVPAPLKAKRRTKLVTPTPVTTPPVTAPPVTAEPVEGGASAAVAEGDISPDVSEALSAVDRSVDRSEFTEWSEEDNPWTHDDESKDEENLYVDLVLNPERYTGYKGDSARRIWEAIYEESCFREGPKDECRERRVFYRLISGFHMSITVHVSTSFLHNPQAGEVQWGPHLEMFKWRVANFPDRLSNLYFTFLFVLRAAMKASDYLSVASYDTGNPIEDQKTSELVRALVANERLRVACPMPFDEAELWKGVEGPQLFHDLQRHFRNISAIMDCVGCERCRLWGKLEMLGLATALKILFSEEKPDTKCSVALQRNEVTALVNTLSRFSEALQSSSKMMALLEKSSLERPAQESTQESTQESIQESGAAATSSSSSSDESTKSH